jgi:hypothetical protein
MATITDMVCVRKLTEHLPYSLVIEKLSKHFYRLPSVCCKTMMQLATKVMHRTARGIRPRIIASDRPRYSTRIAYANCGSGRGYFRLCRSKNFTFRLRSIKMTFQERYLHSNIILNFLHLIQANVTPSENTAGRRSSCQMV